MEAVAADGILLIILVGDAEHIGLGGHGLVEGGIKDRHHGDILPKDLPAGPHSHRLGGIVEGAKLGKLLHGGDELLIHHAGDLVNLPAVEDPVTDGGDFLHVVDDLALPGGEDLHQLHKGLLVGGEAGVVLHLDPGGGLVADVPVHADALAVALCQHAFVAHLDELVLEGRTSGIDYQYFHLRSSFTVLIFKGTVYPIY